MTKVSKEPAGTRIVSVPGRETARPTSVSRLVIVHVSFRPNVTCTVSTKDAFRDIAPENPSGTGYAQSFRGIRGSVRFVHGTPQGRPRPDLPPAASLRRFRTAKRRP